MIGSRLLSIVGGPLVGSLLASGFSPAAAQNDDPGSTPITNARIFIGTGDSLIEGQDVLVENGIITGFGEGIRAPAGAHAALLLFDGNPLEDISILEDPHTVLDPIIKAGVIYKETL